MLPPLDPFKKVTSMVHAINDALPGNKVHRFIHFAAILMK
jgi:hypothetical protein